MPIPRLTVKPSCSSFTALRMIPSRVSIPPPSSLPHGASLDPFLARRDEDAIDEDAGRMHALGIERADLDKFLDLRDRDLARRHRHGVEVARGLPIDEVAEPIALPGRHHREVAHDSALEKVVAAAEASRLLAL